MLKRLLWSIQYKIGDVLDMIYERKMVKIYKNYHYSKFIGHQELIWGVLSHDNMFGSEATLYSMNDIEVLYNHKTKEWSLDIEQIYSFTNGIDGEIEYLQGLLEKFTSWMVENGYNISHTPSIYNKIHIGMNASSIEELYLNFKMYVVAFCEINKRENRV